mgnify:CR=1 FL=1
MESMLPPEIKNPSLGVPNKLGRAAGMKVCAVEDAYSLDQEEEKRRLSDYYNTFAAAMLYKFRSPLFQGNPVGI